MGFEVDLYDQIPWSLAHVVVISFLSHPDVLAVVDPARNLNLLGHATRVHAHATTGAARMLDLDPLSTALLTDHLHGHGALAVVHVAFSSARGTFAGSGARLAFAA